MFHDAFGRFQFGGVKKSSTAAALICLHDRLTFSLDQENTLGVAVLTYDFSKAFDQLGHDVIIKSLQDNNFPSGFVEWVSHYLNNRTQSVKIYHRISSVLRVKSGIPQGSIFGPYLFNVAIASLTAVNRKNTIIKYIDDCTYVIPIESPTPDDVKLEHQNMISWSTNVGLRLNLRKCKLLWIPKSASLSRPVIPDIPSVDEVRILGVTFTSDLKWDKHFDNVTKTAARRLYALRILRSCCSFDVLRHIYHGLILSVMEYCSPLFIAMSNRNCNVLDSIQRRAERIIRPDPETREFLPNLTNRRKTAAVRLFNNIHRYENHPLHGMCPSTSERSGRFLQPLARTTRRRTSFFPATLILINGTFLD